MNHYDILGVSIDSSQDEIKKAWRKIARTTHPDTASGAGAVHIYQAAEKAFHVLSDPVSRKQYDASLRAGNDGAASSSDANSSPKGAPSPPPFSPSSPGQDSSQGEPSWGQESSWEDAGWDSGKRSPFGSPPPPPHGYPFDGSHQGQRFFDDNEEEVVEPVRHSNPRHRHVLRVPLALGIAGITILLTFPLVSAEFNLWGSSFLVVAVVTVALAIIDGEGLRDWKLWAWMLMGAWTMNRHEGGFVENWPTVVFFLVPALVTTMTTWKPGRAPEPSERPQRWTWGKSKGQPVSVKAR